MDLIHSLQQQVIESIQLFQTHFSFTGFQIIFDAAISLLVMKRAQFRITLWVPMPGQQSLNHRHLSGKSSACHCRGFLPTAPWEWAGRSARLVVEHGILVTPSVWLSEEDGAKWELGDDPGTLQRNGPVA